MTWTTNKLKSIASEFLFNEYNLNLDIPIKISKRLKSTFGYLKVKNKKPLEIRLSFEFLSNQPEEIVYDVLLHECVHYALLVKGLPYKDRDQHFKNELARLGISKTRTYTYKGTAHLYQCSGKCKVSFAKRSKNYHKRYRCANCGGFFRYIKQVNVE